MRKSFLVFTLIFGLAGCVTDGSVTVATGPYVAAPYYVYLDEDGSCWADDYRYTVCPWDFNGYVGYRWRYRDTWYWRHDYRWPDRYRQPPRVLIAPPVIDRHHPHGYWRTDPPRRRWIAPPVGPSRGRGGWRR